MSTYRGLWAGGKGNAEDRQSVMRMLLTVLVFGFLDHWNLLDACELWFGISASPIHGATIERHISQ